MGMTGQCLCGAVTFEGQGQMGGVHTCHCADCARWNGGPLMAVEFENGIKVEGPVNWYQSSDWGERGSCSTCGSALFWRMRDRSRINVAVGALDDRSVIEKIASHIFFDSKPDFYDFADDAPRLTGAEVVAQFLAGQDKTDT